MESNLAEKYNKNKIQIFQNKVLQSVVGIHSIIEMIAFTEIWR